jgi:hypothetical protein
MAEEIRVTGRLVPPKDCQPTSIRVSAVGAKVVVSIDDGRGGWCRLELDAKVALELADSLVVARLRLPKEARHGG